MAELDGKWRVERVSGALPPMLGVRKEIAGGRGKTLVADVAGVPFDVVGLELRYRGLFGPIVDMLEPDGEGGYAGRTTVFGREVGRFRMRREGPPSAASA